MTKDEIEFTTTAKLDEYGMLTWFTTVTHVSDEVSDKFREALWDEFSIQDKEIDEKLK